MDKVYVIGVDTVDIDNAYGIDNKAFKSFREASTYLIEKGYEPFYNSNVVNDVWFSKIYEDEIGYEEELIADIQELNIIN